MGHREQARRERERKGTREEVSLVSVHRATSAHMEGKGTPAVESVQRGHADKQQSTRACGRERQKQREAETVKRK